MINHSDAKVDRRVIRSKEALKSTLLKLLTHKPFPSISITEIVTQANYNRGTFYSHYENKEALLSDVIEDVIADLISSFRAPYEKTDSFRIDELHANAIMIFEHIHLHASLYTTMLNSAVLPDFREKMFNALKQIIVEDLEPTDPESHLALNRELQITYSLHALLGLVFHWIEGGFKYSPAYMNEQLVLFLNWKPATLKMRRKDPAK